MPSYQNEHKEMLPWNQDLTRTDRIVQTSKVGGVLCDIIYILLLAWTGDAQRVE